MASSDFRAMARGALQGKWGISLLITFIAVLLGAGSSSSTSVSYNFNNYINQQDFSYSYNYAFSDPSFTRTFAAFAAFFGVIAIGYIILSLILGGTVDLGLKLYNIRLIQGAPNQPVGTLFERFHIFGRALLLRLLVSLFVALWIYPLVGLGLVLIGVGAFSRNLSYLVAVGVIPAIAGLVLGIIAQYRYAMASYLMAQNPGLGVMDSIRHSKEMMKGHKGELFVLHLSFIGWMLLVPLTCGIGALWLNPYICAAEAAFYLNRTGQLPGMQPYGQAPGMPPPPYPGGQPGYPPQQPMSYAPPPPYGYPPQQPGQQGPGFAPPPPPPQQPVPGSPYTPKEPVAPAPADPTTGDVVDKDEAPYAPQNEVEPFPPTAADDEHPVAPVE